MLDTDIAVRTYATNALARLAGLNIDRDRKRMYKRDVPSYPPFKGDSS